MVNMVHLLELGPCLDFLSRLLCVNLLNDEGIEVAIRDFLSVVQHPCVIHVGCVAHKAGQLLKHKTHKEIVFDLKQLERVVAEDAAETCGHVLEAVAVVVSHVVEQICDRWLAVFLGLKVSNFDDHQAVSKAHRVLSESHNHIVQRRPGLFNVRVGVLCLFRQSAGATERGVSAVIGFTLAGLAFKLRSLHLN